MCLIQCAATRASSPLNSFKLLVSCAVSGTASGLPGLRTQNNVGPCTNLTITCNRFVSNSGVGVHIKSGDCGSTNLCSVTNNHFQGNASAAHPPPGHGNEQIELDNGCTSIAFEGNSVS